MIKTKITLFFAILLVVAWYHLAFFVISTAMFGLTAGAVWVYLRGERYSEKTLSYDLAHYGIRVVTIQPGIFETPMFDSMPDKVREALAAGVPFPSRLGRADEYSDLVRYICESDYINGAAIVVGLVGTTASY